MPTSRVMPLTALLLLACGGPEPVLSGIPDEPVLQTDDGEVLGTVEAKPYEKPADVLVDVRHLGGRSFSASRDVITAQLGALQESRELPGDDGRELSFEHAAIRVADDLIYMIRVPLPEPMFRSDALAATGFPDATRRYIVLHREYRLNHERDFRRLRFKRSSPEDELVVEVEAWKWVPGERSSRR